MPNSIAGIPLVGHTVFEPDPRATAVFLNEFDPSILKSTLYIQQSSIIRPSCLAFEIHDSSDGNFGCSSKILPRPSKHGSCTPTLLRS